MTDTNDSPLRVAVVGLGYVGLTTAGRGMLPAQGARDAGFADIGVGDCGTEAGQMARTDRAGKVSRA